MNNGLLVYVLIIVCITIFLTSLLLAFYRKTRYLKIFSGAYACYLSSYMLLASQSHNNLFFSSVISNMFLVAGSLLLIRSVRAYYTSRPEWPKRFWVYLALTGAISYATAILSYNVIFRNILLGTLTVLIFLDFGFYILGRINRMPPIIRGTIAISLLVNTITNAIRPVIALMFLSPQNLPVDSDVLNMFVFTSFTATSILWLGTLILLDSDRMLNETKIAEGKYKTIVDSTDAGVMMIHRQGHFLTYRNLYVSGDAGDIDITRIAALH